VGSLLRPPELLAARAVFGEGKLDQRQLRDVEDRAILEALAQQRAAGVDSSRTTHYLDPEHRAQMQAEGRDPDAELAEGIAGDNAALRDVPRDRVTVAAHLCRGRAGRFLWSVSCAEPAVRLRIGSGEESADARPAVAQVGAGGGYSSNSVGSA